MDTPTADYRPEVMNKEKSVQTEIVPAKSPSSKLVQKKLKETGGMDRFFDAQRQILLSDKYRELLGFSLENELESLEDAIYEDGLETPGNIPFLIVLPERYLNLHHQLRLEGGDVAPGEEVPHDVRNHPKIVLPDRSYVVNDVELGHAFAGPDLSAVRKAICRAGRSPLTVTEGIALFRNFKSVFDMDMHLIGSDYRGDMPGRQVWHFGRFAEEGARYLRTVGAKEVTSWIVPSCANRRSGG